MTRDQRYGTLSAAVLGLCAAMLVLAGLAHCAAAPTPAQQLQVGEFTADDGVCIANATSRAQADQCRDSIRHAFCGAGGILADSGGCVNVRLSDGGLP